MSGEKTIEELQAELESLKRVKLEKEIAKEKAALEEEEKLNKEKEAEELRESIRAELMTEMKGKSTVDEPAEEKLSDNTNSEFENFKKHMKEKYGLTGEGYESICRRIADPGNFKGERK